MDQEIKQLEDRVAGLLKWKDERSEERLTFPLDFVSRRTLNYYSNPLFSGLPVSTGRLFPSFLDVITELLAVGLEVRINGQKRILLLTIELNQFTVNTSTDVITNSAGSHNLNNGDQIAFTSTNFLPVGLSALSIYYVINRTGTTFQVSTTRGGSAVDITTSGTGTQYYGLQ